jgi:hypothetical protein
MKLDTPLAQVQRGQLALIFKLDTTLAKVGNVER